MHSLLASAEIRAWRCADMAYDGLNAIRAAFFHEMFGEDEFLGEPDASPLWGGQGGEEGRSGNSLGVGWRPATKNVAEIRKKVLTTRV